MSKTDNVGNLPTPHEHTDFDDDGFCVVTDCQFNCLVPDKTELNLCSTCNTMKNIPVGETVCARCKTEDSLTIFSLFSKYSEPCLTEDEHIIAYDDFATDLKALVQAERIKAKNEGAYFALLEHECVYTDEITKGEVYRKLVRQIEKEKDELDTPKGGEK